jgi:hypothetical protein
MVVKLEKEIQRNLLKQCKKHSKVAWMDRANSGKVRVRGGFMQLHEKGTPDLIGFTCSGRFIGIELKRHDTKKNLKPEQEHFQKIMTSCSCVFGVAYDEESLMAILDKIE